MFHSKYSTIEEKSNPQKTTSTASRLGFILLGKTSRQEVIKRQAEKFGRLPAP